MNELGYLSVPIMNVDRDLGIITWVVLAAQNESPNFFKFHGIGMSKEILVCKAHELLNDLDVGQCYIYGIDEVNGVM
jgi:hypothetical protein